MTINYISGMLKGINYMNNLKVFMFTGMKNAHTIIVNKIDTKLGEEITFEEALERQSIFAAHGVPKIYNLHDTIKTGVYYRKPYAYNGIFIEGFVIAMSKYNAELLLDFFVKEF